MTRFNRWGLDADTYRAETDRLQSAAGPCPQHGQLGYSNEYVQTNVRRGTAWCGLCGRQLHADTNDESETSCPKK